MSVVFQFQPTEPARPGVYALANDDRILPVKIRSQARECLWCCV